MSLCAALLGGMEVTEAAPRRVLGQGTGQPAVLGQLLCSRCPGMIVSDAPFTLKGFQAWAVKQALILLLRLPVFTVVFSCIPKSSQINTAWCSGENRSAFLALICHLQFPGNLDQFLNLSEPRVLHLYNEADT